MPKWGGAWQGNKDITYALPVHMPSIHAYCPPHRGGHRREQSAPDQVAHARRARFLEVSEAGRQPPHAPHAHHQRQQHVLQSGGAEALFLLNAELPKCCHASSRALAPQQSWVVQ